MDEETLLIYIEESQAGARLDKFLSEQTQASRNNIQNRIAAGDILVNSLPVKANYVLRTGDCVTVEAYQPKTVDLIPEDIPLDILYEDKDLLIVNKPKGMVVHPSIGHTTGTLVNAVPVAKRTPVTASTRSLQAATSVRISSAESRA